MNKVLNVKCPQCNKGFSYYDSESRPFCSERCKMIDLGHWFEESYKVPVKSNVFQEDEFQDEGNEIEDGQEENSESDSENYN